VGLYEGSVQERFASFTGAGGGRPGYAEARAREALPSSSPTQHRWAHRMVADGIKGERWTGNELRGASGK